MKLPISEFYKQLYLYICNIGTQHLSISVCKGVYNNKKINFHIKRTKIVNKTILNSTSLNIMGNLILKL